MWVVVAESSEPGEFHVGLLRDDETSIDGSYDIPRLGPRCRHYAGESRVLAQRPPITAPRTPISDGPRSMLRAFTKKQAKASRVSPVSTCAQGSAMLRRIGRRTVLPGYRNDGDEIREGGQVIDPWRDSPRRK